MRSYEPAPEIDAPTLSEAFPQYGPPVT